MKMSGIVITFTLLKPLCFSAPVTSPPLPPFARSSWMKPCENGNRRSRRATSPPVHLYVLCQLVSTLQLITERVTGIEIHPSLSSAFKTTLGSTSHRTNKQHRVWRIWSGSMFTGWYKAERPPIKRPSAVVRPSIRHNMSANHLGSCDMSLVPMSPPEERRPCQLLLTSTNDTTISACGR